MYRGWPNKHCSKSSFFVQKFNFDFPRKLSIFLSGKTRENVVVLDFLAVDNFDFTRKIVKNILGEKLVKMLGFCQNSIFGQQFDFSNSVEMLERREMKISFYCCVFWAIFSCFLSCCIQLLKEVPVQIKITRAWLLH